jgi:hypothetical protein
MLSWVALISSSQCPDGWYSSRSIYSEMWKHRAVPWRLITRTHSTCLSFLEGLIVLLMQILRLHVDVLTHNLHQGWSAMLYCVYKSAALAFLHWQTQILRVLPRVFHFDYSFLSVYNGYCVRFGPGVSPYAVILYRTMSIDQLSLQSQQALVRLSRVLSITI